MCYSVAKASPLTLWNLWTYAWCLWWCKQMNSWTRRRRRSVSRGGTGPRSTAASCRLWSECSRGRTTLTPSCERIWPVESTSPRLECRYVLDPCASRFLHKTNVFYYASLHIKHSIHQRTEIRVILVYPWVNIVYGKWKFSWWRQTIIS